MLVFHWTYHRVGSSDLGRSKLQKPIVDNTLKKGASHHGTSRDFLNHCLRNCTHRSSEQDNKGRMVVTNMAAFCIRRDDSQSDNIHSWTDLGDKSRVDSLQSPHDQIGLGSELNTTDVHGNQVEGTVTGLAVVDGHLRVEVK